MATPVNAIAPAAPRKPIPAHRSHPFCKLNGSLKSENRHHNTPQVNPESIFSIYKSKMKP